MFLSVLGCLGMLRKVFKCFGMSWDVFGCLERRWQRLGMFKMCFDEPKNPLKLGCLKGCSWFMGWFGILGCLGMSLKDQKAEDTGNDLHWISGSLCLSKNCWPRPGVTSRGLEPRPCAWRHHFIDGSECIDWSRNNEKFIQWKLIFIKVERVIGPDRKVKGRPRGEYSDDVL